MSHLPTLFPAPHGLQIARIRVDVRINREFDYLIPEHLAASVRPGMRVRIPFGSRVVFGTVLHLRSSGEVPEGDLKSILDTVGTSEVITPEILKLADWMANYYLCPLDVVLKTLAPSVVQKRGSMRKVRRSVDVELEEDRTTLLPTNPLSLSSDQSKALDQILDPERLKTLKPVLLFGVTGSGKTEIYLQAIQKMLDQGKGAILLVPEIALTPQTVAHLRSRFSPRSADPKSGTVTLNLEESPLAILHSGLSQGERFRAWQRVRNGEARVVVGARSAVFAPVRNLGLIVVDEEHEHTYKQEESPHYHARDVAVVRGGIEHALVVLGSATPSLESYRNTELGKYDLCQLPNRVDSRKLPAIQIVDMRREIFRQKGYQLFSQALRSAILSRLEKGEQVILYLNRRGYTTSFQCAKCGYVATCDSCSIALVYHRSAQHLKCHLCGKQYPVPNECPESHCRNPEMRHSGMGTEKLEETVLRQFPHARIARMDSDTMKRRDDYEKTLLRFKMGKIDILLGTQMIAKGLDFPRVTLVGIVHADVGLHLPDFRSGERAFQQITQVSGRAGRGTVEGEVFIQTFTPDHPAIRHGRHQNYERFYREEIQFREKLGYPPHGHLIRLECSSHQATQAEYVCMNILERLREGTHSPLDVWGPAPAAIEKVKGRHRFLLYLKQARRKDLREILQRVIASLPRQTDVRVNVDVDPQQII